MAYDSLMSAGSNTPSQADLFRDGRLGMGWSQADLARTVLVEEATLQGWESGSRPIPAPILAWVGMYVRSASADQDAETADA